MMIMSPLFRRHYFISVVVLVVGLLASFFASFSLTSFERSRMVRGPVDQFRILSAATGAGPEETVRMMNERRFIPPGPPPMGEKDGMPMPPPPPEGGGMGMMPPPGGPPGMPPPPMMRLTYLRPDAKEITGLSSSQRADLDAGEPLEFSPSFFGPPQRAIFALGNGQGYLQVSFGPHRGGPKFPYVALACLFLGVILATGVAIFILFSSYRKRAKIAAEVLSELKSGNLSARLPEVGMDELAELVHSFNQMADEVEKLVSGIRRTEKGRMEMLQSLAHDLRTPIASMKTFLESMRDHRDRMTPDQQQRSLELCLAETGYFEHLVEDLLILASLAEPKYSKDADVVRPERLGAIVAETPSNRVRVSFVEDVGVKEGPGLRGDHRLLERLLRNGLDNAISFARSQVELRLERIGETYVFSITDDGPGLSEEALREFGHRRKARKMVHAHGTRVSSGIGSVIMKEIAELHGGHVEISNSIVDGEVRGACLKISLPAL